MAESVSSTKRNGNGDDRPGNRKRIYITPEDFVVEPLPDDLPDPVNINVKLPAGRVIPFEVKRSDTVGSVKVRIEAEARIPFDQQELIFDQMVLQDMDTFSILPVKNESRLTLMRKWKGLIEISIKHPDGNVTFLEVKPCDTIRSVKDKLFSIDNGDVLVFDDNVLDDDGILSDLNIVNGSELALVYEFDAFNNMEIFVKSYTGKTFSFCVRPTYSIFDVKLAIMEEVDIPHDQMVLVYNGMALGNNGTLLDFNIDRKSTLTLMHRPREFKGFMQIFIKTPTGETIAQEVQPYDTIREIKAMIQDKVHVPSDEQELIYNEMVIHDVHSLADFHISNESTLTLMRISTGLMRVFIKNQSGKTCALDVAPSYTIKDVKLKFKEGPSPSRQRLLFNGKELNDNATLAHYHVTKDSTILCEFLMY